MPKDMLTLADSVGLLTLSRSGRHVLAFVEALVRWATGKRLTNRLLPKTKACNPPPPRGTAGYSG